MAIRHNWGIDQVYYHDTEGRLRTLPITWTSLIPQDLAVTVGAGRAPFKLSDLLELARLIKKLHAQDDTGKLPVRQATDGRGGVK